MTLDQLEKSLPNGLHDAELVGLQVDYARREAVLDLNVDCSEPPESEPYRPARILFSGIQFLVIDLPATADAYNDISIVDAGSGQPSTAPCKLPPLPDDCFLCWLFVVRWNSFIRIAARSAALEWVDRKQTP